MFFLWEIRDGEKGGDEVVVLVVKLSEVSLISDAWFVGSYKRSTNVDVVGVGFFLSFFFRDGTS